MDPIYPLVISVLGAIGALGAAAAAFRAASAARSAVRTQIILDFSKRDADPEMAHNIRVLWAFARESDGDLLERFTALASSDKNRYETIENARRLVHKFFLQLIQAKRLGLITDEEIITCFYRHQFETVVNVLQPLERTTPGWPYTKPMFDEYARLYNNYDALYKKRFGGSVSRK